jgi:hypothetical protein
MNVIFLGLVIWNVLLLVATVYTGMQGWPVWHFSLGVFTGIFTCLTHSLVFIQLIGSGKGIKEAVSAYSLPDDPKTGYIARTKKFKSIAFPYAMFVPMITIAAAWIGAWHDTNKFAAPQWLAASHQWHMWIAWITVFTNLYAFWKEYQVIADNTVMIREINELIQKKSKDADAEMNKASEANGVK